MRVLVCGGRTFGDDEHYEQWKFGMEWLKQKFEGVTGITFLSGMAKGADELGEDFYLANHPTHRLLQFPADWKTHGKKAGFLRNTRMLVEGKPDLVIAFPGGTGTKMMVEIARKAGVEVIEVLL